MRRFFKYLRGAHRFFVRESVSYAGERPSLAPRYIRAYCRFMYYSIENYVRLPGVRNDLFK